VSIEGSDRNSGTICTLVWLLLLLWALLIPVQGKTLTGQAPGSMLTHALPRQCINTVAGFDFPLNRRLSANKEPTLLFSLPAPPPDPPPRPSLAVALSASTQQLRGGRSTARSHRQVGNRRIRSGDTAGRWPPAGTPLGRSSKRQALLQAMELS